MLRRNTATERLIRVLAIYFHSIDGSAAVTVLRRQNEPVLSVQED